MSLKIVSDFSFQISKSGNYIRELTLFANLYKDYEEKFIQIKDYCGVQLQPNGLCFKVKEFIWFINQIGVKNRNTSIFKTKSSKIYYQQVYDLICVYQETPRKSTIFVFNINEIIRICNNKSEILAQVRELCSDKSECMDIDVEPPIKKAKYSNIDEPLNIRFSNYNIEKSIDEVDKKYG